MRFAPSLVALALAGLLAPSAGAQQLTSRDQVSSPTTVTWTGATVGTTTASQTGGGFTVNASTNGDFSPLTAGGSWAGGFTDGDALLYTQSGTFIELAFSSMLNAFATQMWHNYGTYPVTFEVFRGVTSLFSTMLSVTGGNAANANQAPVLGFADAGGFDRVRISSSSDFSIDELTISRGGLPNTTVPEPSTVILLGSGLAGIAAVSRRRRKQS